MKHREKQGVRLELIAAPLFVTGLAILLVNDFYLKYELANQLTGKLSDVAGLFIFPYFLAAIFPKYRQVVYLLTLVLFGWWKSPVSQEFISWWNTIGVPTHRTVDYTDLLALLVLPLSYWYLKRQLNKEASGYKSLTIGLAALSLFAFGATTLQSVPLDTSTDTDVSFILPMNKSEFFASITAAYLDSVPLNLEDSLFYLTFPVPEYRADVEVLAVITRLDSTQTQLHLDSVLSAYITGGLFSEADQEDVEAFNQLEIQDLERLFEENFVKKLDTEDAKRLYYYTEKTYDYYRTGKSSPSSTFEIEKN